MEALEGPQLDWIACSSQRHSSQPAVPSSLLCVRHLSAGAAEEQGVAWISSCSCMDRTRRHRPSHCLSVRPEVEEELGAQREELALVARGAQGEV